MAVPASATRVLRWVKGNMNKMILKAALLASIAVAGNAQAAGVPGQGTWETTLLGRDIYGNAVTQRDSNGLDSSAVFLYDTVLDVTWLRDANYANGRMRWDAANTWASNLTVGVYDGWRLPTLSNPSIGNPGNDTTNEMASLWYGALGNAQGALSNTGDFQNLQSDYYWSGLEYAPSTTNAWYFDTGRGVLNREGKADALYALAVLDGDVLAPIPEPETYALMLAGLAVVGAAAKRRKAK